jgi:hypothetical protein
VSDPKVLAVARGTLEGEIPAQTPSGTPNVRLVVVSAARVVAIRAIPADSLDPQTAWQRIGLAAGLALFPAFVSVCQNILELLARLDVTQPELRG